MHLRNTAFLLSCLSVHVLAQYPGPSWNDTPTRKAIVSFVERVIKPGSPDFVPVAERIAVFDNDGTLWSEQPMYFEFLYTFDRVKQLAPQHPEWQSKEPFASVLKGNIAGAMSGGTAAVLDLLAATHGGVTDEEFEKSVRDWLATARHPSTKMPYTSMVYQPMLELLQYLRANGFKTFIVSGGEVSFMRVWVEKVYGIPPEQVIGTTMKLSYELKDGKPAIIRKEQIAAVNDGPGKPLGISAGIGRRPVAAFGNSDGDLQMLQYTADGTGLRFCLYVHHTDADREFAYDRQSSIGRLDKGLDEAARRGWTVVDMKTDWKTIYPASEK